GEDEVAVSAPDDHFTATPHCRVTCSGIGCVGSAGGGPTIRAGIVSAASVQIHAAIISTPDDHFTASPHCCGNGSGSGRVGEAGSCPTVRAGIVSAASVKIRDIPIDSPSHNHFTPGSLCRMILPCGR